LKGENIKITRRKKNEEHKHKHTNKTTIPLCKIIKIDFPSNLTQIPLIARLLSTILK